MQSQGEIDCLYSQKSTNGASNNTHSCYWQIHLMKCFDKSTCINTQSYELSHVYNVCEHVIDFIGLLSNCGSARDDYFGFRNELWSFLLLSYSTLILCLYSFYILRVHGEHEEVFSDFTKLSLLSLGNQILLCNQFDFMTSPICNIFNIMYCLICFLFFEANCFPLKDIIMKISRAMFCYGNQKNDVIV